MNCQDCTKEFEYFPGEEDAYSKFENPLPLNCPECRQWRRLIFRNERKLYYNKSHISGKQLIALYPPTSPFKIIDLDEWWDDSFDATKYARDFDFSRTFFEQFKELQLEVPRWSRMYVECENSDFSNNCHHVNNSYLAFSSHSSEDLYYCVKVFHSNTCIDCYIVNKSEYCSMCVDCDNCYNTHYSQLAKNCSDSLLLYDCRSCKNCIMCSGLKNEEYMILNEKYTKYEYEEKKKEILQTLATNKKSLFSQLEELKSKAYHRNLQIINSENCVGDFILNSKNIQNGFNIFNCQDCINVYYCDELKDSYDNNSNDKSELCLECDTCFDAYGCRFSTYFVGAKFCQYLDQCFYLKNSFGCVGLKKGEHMILNKKYSSEDYKKMIKKIEDHMKQTGEFGKPFPASLTSFAYSDTIAYETHPLTKEECLRKGFIWNEEERAAEHFGKRYEIPANIEEVDDSICDQILTCEITGKNYKIIPQELRFYKKFKLPIPRISPDQRYKDLIQRQRPKALRDTTCHFCRKPIKTTYSKAKDYRITCNECYLKTTY